jgi:hypothetical protein
MIPTLGSNGNWLWASPMVGELIAGLPVWGGETAMSGHDSHAYLPSLLGLLSDLGVRAADDDRIERALDDVCVHQNDDLRFVAFGRAPATGSRYGFAALRHAHHHQQGLHRPRGHASRRTHL